MRRLPHVLVASFAGVGTSALMQIAFVPVYIRLMGVEAFGLVGFFATLQVIANLFDFGLSMTMSRQMARYAAAPELASEARDFVRTLEIVYWILGAAIGLFIVLAAPFVAQHWIKPNQLAEATVRDAIRLMGVVTALQWPITLYHSGLIGLQEQVTAYVALICASILRGAGAALALWLHSPTINTYFAWQAIIAAVQVCMTLLLLWRQLPASQQPVRWNPKLLSTVWRFAAGTSGIMVLTAILTNLDKVILSNLLSLQTFGYYSLATIFVTGMTALTTPVFSAFYPRFSTLALQGDHEAAKNSYHLGCQVMSVVLMPPAILLALFSFEALWAWTGNVEVSRNVAPIVSLLVLGSLLNGLMSVPYALQLSSDWTKLTLTLQAVLVLIQAPAVILMTLRFGALGAAVVWAVLNALYVFLGITTMHRRLLKGELRKWFLDDVGWPMLGVAIVTLAWRQVFTTPPTPGRGLAALGLGFSSALVVAVLLAPQLRQRAMRLFSLTSMARRLSSKYIDKV